MFENLTITIDPGHPSKYTSEEIIYLTGIIGIHPDLGKQDDIRVEISPLGDCTRVIVKSSAIKHLVLVIYYAFNCINNLKIRAARPKSGVAPKWVLSQSTAASAQKLVCLEAYAYKDGSPEDWSGYIVWGKVGYLMHEGSIKEFEKLMRDNSRTEKSLEELLSHKEGLEFWIAEGFPWQARFDLDKDSESNRILHEYIKRKNRQS